MIFFISSASAKSSITPDLKKIQGDEYCWEELDFKTQDNFKTWDSRANVTILDIL